MLRHLWKLTLLTGVTAGTILISDGTAASVSWRAQDPAVQKSEPRRIVPMHPSLAAARITQRSEVVYPDEAKSAGISGAVLLDVTVDEQGSVEAVQPLAGYPVLLDAAVETVRHWRYLPFSQDGAVVAFKATLVVNFVLTDPDTPHLWLSVDGETGKQGSNKPLNQKDLGRLFQKSPIALISHDPKTSFRTLEASVRDLSDRGLKYPQMTFFVLDEGRLYYVSRNPGAPEGPEIGLEDIPGARPLDAIHPLFTIFQIFVSAEGQVIKVLRMTGPPRLETEEALKAVKLERPMTWQNEAVPATFYVRVY